MLNVIRNHFILEALKKHCILTLTSLCVLFLGYIALVWYSPNGEYAKLGLCVVEQTSKGNYQAIMALCYNPYMKSLGITKENIHPIFDDYPMILNPDSLYLSDIGDKGWKIQINVPAQIDMKLTNSNELMIEDWTKIIPLSKDTSYRYIGIISSEFNNGKTWLLNQLTGYNFPSGLDYDTETKGICFVLPQNENDKYIFIDTEGKKRPVPESKLQDRSMTDLFVEELIPEISDIIIYIVKELDADSQINLKKLIERVATLNRGSVAPKKLLVVHNYLRIIDNDIIEQHIQRDIIKPYGGQKDITDIGIFYYHHDIETELEIRHFIIANQGSEAGKKWNANSLKLMKSELRSSFLQKRDFMEHLKFHLSGLMREYFKSPQRESIQQQFIDGQDYGETKVEENNKEDKGGLVYDLFRRGLAWMGGNNKDTKYILSTANNKDINVPKEIKNEIANKIDPWELTITAVDSQYVKNGCDHCAIISLKHKRVIEYESVQEIGQRPQVGPDINCRTLKNKMNTIWVLECDVAGAILSEHGKIDIYDKIGVKIDDENNMVSVFGTISKGIDVGNENFAKYGTLEIEHEDKPTYGWFWKSYKAPAWIQQGWRERNQTINDGRLVVVVDIR